MEERKKFYILIPLIAFFFPAFKQEAPHFHIGQGLANYIDDPAFCDNQD